MKLSDFDYFLPKELIAQHPSDKREGSRLLVLHRDTGRIEHKIFNGIVDYFHKGDLLVLNNTRVVPAKLVGRKETGGKVEALILRTQGFCHGGQARLGSRENEYEALLKPTRGCNIGSKLIFGDGELLAEISKIENGRRFLKFNSNGNLEGLLDSFGAMPLPPYIKREPADLDKDRYQTVYADKNGAVAAPTAGLHFTNDILSCISNRGVDIGYITLHVGYGTFKPVKYEDITKHKMEEEYFEAEKGITEKLKANRGRTIAVGTSTCRTIETIASKMSGLEQRAYYGWTDLFIYPGYRFGVVDALLTNFHLPKTTLLMLVSAFCGRELLFKAYKEAIKQRYRFYSYGDAMLIL